MGLRVDDDTVRVCWECDGHEVMEVCGDLDVCPTCGTIEGKTVEMTDDQFEKLLNDELHCSNCQKPDESFLPDGAPFFDDDYCSEECHRKGMADKMAEYQYDAEKDRRCEETL